MGKENSMTFYVNSEKFLKEGMHYSFQETKKDTAFFKCIRHEKLKRNSVHLLAGEGKLIAGDNKVTGALNLPFSFGICQKVNCCLKGRQGSVWNELNQNK